MRNLVIILLISLSGTLSSCAQNSSQKMTNIIQHEGISAPIHKANVGKIIFTSAVIPLDEYKESDFLSSFEIKENSEFYIRAFLGNSLTNYLHQLDTSLTAEQLVQKGNYQLSFYVDGDLIYTENIGAGAGSPASKNKNTTLHVPLLSEINTDFWSRFAWMRFYFRNGGEAALEKGTHVLKLEIRPYLEHNGLHVGDLIAQGEIELKVKEPEKATKKQMAVQPIASGSGWKLSNDRFDEDKIRELNKKIIERRFKNITSIVVIKDGELLLEEYFNGANRNTMHDTRSVGKSFASTMTGIALEEGHIKNVNQTLSDFYDLSTFANYSPKKDRVTLQSLLTMSSGFDGNDNDYDSPGNEENMYPTDNWVKFTLDLKMDPAKQVGKNWDYFTAGVVVLGDVIDKSVPGGLEKYADEKLFKPLGISKYQWQHTPQGVANTAGGLQMNTLDYARFGQLYKNKGLWGDQRILSRRWVNRSLTNYFSETPDQTPYGYLFWNQKFSANNTSYEAFLSNGNGGNKIIIFKDQPLVIIVTATAYGRPYAHPQVDQILQEYVLPAVIK